MAFLTFLLELVQYGMDENQQQSKVNKSADEVIPTLQILSSKEGRKVFQGLNAITEQYLFKLRKEKGINVPRGCYHAVMTTEEMIEFDYWRQVRKEKSRQRFFHYKWDRALEFWTKETKYGKYLRAS